MQALTFGSLDLTHYCYVRIERPPAARMAFEVATVAGRDGDVVTGAALEPLEVTAHCILKRRYLGEWDTLRIALAEALSKREPQVLRLPDEDGLWRRATATLDGTLTMPASPPIEFDVTFCDHDCRAYGDTRTVSVTAGTTATLSVSHGGPDVTVTASSARRDSTTHQWGVVIDGSCYVCVELPTSSSTAVRIECAGRKVTVAGATSMLTLSSDWPELAAGDHTVQLCQGTGAATITITERCL